MNLIAHTPIDQTAAAGLKAMIPWTLMASSIVDCESVARMLADTSPSGRNIYARHFFNDLRDAVQRGEIDPRQVVANGGFTAKQMAPVRAVTDSLAEWLRKLNVRGVKFWSQQEWCIQDEAVLEHSSVSGSAYTDLGMAYLMEPLIAAGCTHVNSCGENGGANRYGSRQWGTSLYPARLGLGSPQRYLDVSQGSPWRKLVWIAANIMRSSPDSWGTYKDIDHPTEKGLTRWHYRVMFRLQMAARTAKSDAGTTAVLFLDGADERRANHVTVEGLKEVKAAWAEAAREHRAAGSPRDLRPIPRNATALSVLDERLCTEDEFNGRLIRRAV